MEGKRRKFIKYMLSPFDNASRNKRELSVVSGFGWEVVVCASGPETCVKEIDGYTVYQRARKLSGRSVFRKFQILYGFLISEPRYLRQYRADVISCHDLTALFSGWVSTWFTPRKHKPHLVYDSHEFEIGRFSEKKRSMLVRPLIGGLEKFLMKKCAFSMMVNDTIADEVRRIHGLKERPVVVRNTPPFRKIEESVCRMRRNEFIRRMGAPEDTFLTMYHGVVAHCRGIEMLLDAVSGNGHIAAVILGDGDAVFLEELHRKAGQLGVTGRVLFHPAVPSADLWQYTGAVDAGMVTIPPASKSYRYMLPNKFFEYIQSETPVIGSNFPEIAKIVNRYDIGLLADPENREEIDAALEKMRTDKEMYRRFKNNLRDAKADLCWEKERRILEAAYAGLWARDREAM